MTAPDGVPTDGPPAPGTARTVDPCSVAGCPARQRGTVRLHLGGVPVDVPLCPAHAAHWRRTDPYLTAGPLPQDVP